MERKQKILFVITKSNFGGAQRYVYDLATSLPSERYDASVALGGSGPLKKKLDAAGITTMPLSLSQGRTFLGDVLSFGPLFTLLRIIREQRPDIVHVNSAKAGGLGALAARLAGTSCIVFTAHGWEFNAPRSALAKVGIKFFSWLTVLLSHTTICVSEAIRRDIASLPFIKNKLTVVKSGIRETKILPREEARAALANKHPLLSQHDTATDIWVGTVAELHPVKGLPYAIEAIDVLRKKVPNVRYLVLSDGKERERLERLIQERELSGHVFLLGFVDEAPKYGCAFDVYAFPSLSEALALAVLEAGQAGLPVVATRVGGIPEIVEHEKTGLLVPPRDADALASGLQRLIDSEPLQRKLGNALRERVQSEFSLERMVRETREVYEN